MCHNDNFNCIALLTTKHHINYFSYKENTLEAKKKVFSLLNSDTENARFCVQKLSELH